MAGALLYAPPAAAVPYTGTTIQYGFPVGPSPEPTWSTSITVGAASNSWWIEIYTSDDVIGVDVVGTDFYLSLTKQPWGAWAAAPPREMQSGETVKIIARRSDGSTAASVSFGWMTDSSPDTHPGWNASFSIHQCGPLTLEATISSAAVTAKVRIGTAGWAAMTKNPVTQRWEKTLGVPLGTKYLVRAYLPPGTVDAPQAYDLIRTC